MWFQYTINVSGHLGIDFNEKIRSSAEYSESLSPYDLTMVVYTGYKTCAYCVDYTGLKPREFLRAHVNCVYKKEYIQIYHYHTFLQGSYMFSDLLPSIYTHLETWTIFFLAVVVNENIPGDMLFLRKGGETSIVLAILIL